MFAEAQAAADFTKMELKAAGLLERVSTITTQYEELVANLRVDLTLLNYDKEQLQKRVEELEKELAAKKESEVVSGEVVEAD